MCLGGHPNSIQLLRKASTTWRRPRLGPWHRAARGREAAGSAAAPQHSLTSTPGRLAALCSSHPLRRLPSGGQTSWVQAQALPHSSYRNLINSLNLLTLSFPKWANNGDCLAEPLAEQSPWPMTLPCQWFSVGEPHFLR